jgi:hypothetical protein
MTAQLDHDLSRHHWETLKGLRAAHTDQGGCERLGLPKLVELGLATLDHGRPRLTTKGRQALLRGSPQLWDLAA